MSAPYFPVSNAVLNAAGLISDLWRQYFTGTNTTLATLTAAINAVPGVNYFTIATQPTLGPSDAGFVGYEKDTGHYVYFDGTAWQLLGSGDAPGRFDHFAVAPVSGWQRCDGTVTTYLIVGGATLTTTSFTTPNLSSTPAYLKDGAYTGTINAAVTPTGTGTGTTGTGTTGTGTTGTGTTGTGTTGDEASHTHSVNGSVQSGGPGLAVGGSTQAIEISTTSGAGSAHNHSVPGLSVPGLSVPGLHVPGLSVPALSIGTIEMANVMAPIYFRR